MVTAYRSLFSAPAFRWFWTGFTVSALGDAMSQVALVWMVFDRTHSVETLGLFSVAYTGPVLVGGLAAGWLLDRVDRRAVMLVDSLFRGLVMAAGAVVAAGVGGPGQPHLLRLGPALAPTVALAR